MLPESVTLYSQRMIAYTCGAAPRHPTSAATWARFIDKTVIEGRKPSVGYRVRLCIFGRCLPEEEVVVLLFVRLGFNKSHQGLPFIPRTAVIVEASNEEEVRLSICGSK